MSKWKVFQRAEDFGVYDSQLASTKRWRSLSQVVEILPGQSVEIVFAPSERQYTALALWANSRLELIDKILDHWQYLRPAPPQIVEEAAA